MGLVFGDLGKSGELVHLLEAAQPVAQAPSFRSDHNHRAARGGFFNITLLSGIILNFIQRSFQAQALTCVPKRPQQLR